jgi:hypothetical protein
MRELAKPILCREGSFAQEAKLLKICEEITSIFELIELHSRRTIIEKLSPEEFSDLMKINPGSSHPTASHEGIFFSKLVPEEVKHFLENFGNMVTNFRESDLNSKGGENENQFRDSSQNLNAMLHKIGPLEIKIGTSFDQAFDKLFLKLQVYIFNLINYMHYHGFITDKEFQLLFEAPHTLEIAAINAFNFKFPHEMNWNSYLTSEYVLHERGEPLHTHYRMKGRT